jgi:hypothetical protein
MLDPDSANPEAERLFMTVLSLVHHDNRLHIMRLFPHALHTEQPGWKHL